MKKDNDFLYYPSAPEGFARNEKTGFWAGQIERFLRKNKKGETIEDAAKMELPKEAGIKVGKMEKAGVVDFSWKNKEDILEINISRRAILKASREKAKK